MKLYERGIFPAALFMKHSVELFSAYIGEEKPEIVTSPSFSRRSTFHQIILKIASVSLEKLLRKLFWKKLKLYQTGLKPCRKTKAKKEAGNCSFA
jgi:hypothetical protein